MKKRLFQSLCKNILPHLPGFTSRGWLLYECPVNHILRGFYFDGSNFDPTIFTVTAFALPLYVPTTHLHLSFGERLKDERGCSKWWNIQAPDLSTALLSGIQREGLPFLDGAREPLQMSALVQRLPGNTAPQSLEAVAYSLAMADQYRAAEKALDRLVKSLDAKIEWQAEMIARAELLNRKLHVDSHGIKQLFMEWEQATVNHLGL